MSEETYWVSGSVPDIAYNHDGAWAKHAFYSEPVQECVIKKAPVNSETLVKSTKTKILRIDIETFSIPNLSSEGLYKYAEQSEIILFGWKYNDGRRGMVDLLDGESVPDFVMHDLLDSGVIKKAHNAAFEIENISKDFNMKLDRIQWRCTMVKCAISGLPMGLEQAGAVLNLDIQKDKIGKKCISFFCLPCKPTKANGFRTRNYPEHDPELWEQFKKYCGIDIDSEEAIDDKLNFISMGRNEIRLWALDQRINHFGVAVNQDFARNAVHMDALYRSKLIAEAIETTGLSNPNSRDQLKFWLEEKTDTAIDNLRKDNIPKLLEQFDDATVKRVLTIKQELGKTSVSKYKTMLRSVCADGRIKGMLQFCGAGRTWRWAGRLLQLHNLPKGIYKGVNLDLAREFVLNKDSKGAEMFFGAVPDMLSQLIRSSFVASPGKRLIVSDFSSIEARLIAWLAGERWRLDVFNTHGKIYEASASQMFHIPIEDIEDGSSYRDKGKIAELALGYQGGVNALIKMGALAMGIDESELQAIVDAWRKANPKIVKLWYDIDRAAKQCIRTGEKIILQKGLSFEYRNSYLFINLPSGRFLAYPDAVLAPGKYGDEIRYMGLSQTSKKWCQIKSYGGKLVENIIQALGRDCLAQALMNLYEAGYHTVFHVHDETVNEEEECFGSMDEVNELMVKPAPWMAGIPLAAKGYEGYYYKKG